MYISFAISITVISNIVYQADDDFECRLLFLHQSDRLTLQLADHIISPTDDDFECRLLFLHHSIRFIKYQSYERIQPISNSILVPLFSAQYGYIYMDTLVLITHRKKSKQLMPLWHLFIIPKRKGRKAKCRQWDNQFNNQQKLNTHSSIKWPLWPILKKRHRDTINFHTLLKKMKKN